MHGLDHLIVDLAFILVLAGIVTVLFKKLKQPVVLGYIVVGILVSPNLKFTPTLVNISDINVFATIGIVFLMFALGLEFSFHKIAKVGGSAVITAGTVMPMMTLIGFSVGSAMGWETMNCIFLGCMLSISSTMIIIKSYDEMNLKSEKFAQVVLGSLVIEDIVAIFMMIVLTTLSVSSSFSGVELAEELTRLLLSLVVILCVGIYVLPTLLNKIKDLISDEILLIISMGICLLMVIISTKAGFSEALGAFLAGSILAGTTFAERIEELVQPIKDFFGAIFFVSIGMMVNPSMLVEYIVPIIIITLVTIFGKMLLSTVGAFLSGQTIESSVRVGFSMVQVGEFSFIMAALGISLGVMSDFLYQIIVFVSVFTTFITPIFIKNGEAAQKMLVRAIPDKWSKLLNSYTEEKGKSSRLDNDWRMFLKSYAVKNLVSIAIMFIIYMVSLNFVLPNMLLYIDDPPMVKSLIAVASISLLAPFINIICRKRNVIYNKLWMKNSINKIPLIISRAFSLFVSAIAIMAIIRGLIIPMPLWLEILFALITVAIFAKSDFMKGKTLNLEVRFISNFNEKILKLRNYESRKQSAHHRILEDIYAVDFQARCKKPITTINDFNDAKAFGVTIVQIIRENGEYVNVIKAGTKVHDGDIITAVGSRYRIEAYLMRLEQQNFEVIKSTKIETLAEHIYTQIFEDVAPENRLVCMEIPVSRKSTFYKKPIRENRFREKYKGSILGVERNNLPILSPSPSFVLSDGDIIWAIGTQIMVDEIMQHKLMTEEEMS